MATIPTTTESPNPSASATPLPPSNTGLLNPRSCTICRRRKVKCDKKQPCSNCVKAHSVCVFPAPGRAPRKPRKPQDAELMDRLRRLEGVVQSLGAQVQSDDGENPSKDDKELTPNDTGNEASEKNPETHEDKIRKAIKELRDLKREQWEKDGRPKPPVDTGLENRFGRLVVGDGKSRYINPSFWASLSHEVWFGILCFKSRCTNCFPGGRYQRIPRY